MRGIRTAFLLALLSATATSAAPRKLRIGVTLHPYYSWTVNVVGEAAEVVPVLPADVDPHAYQPRPEEIRRLETLDAVVVNGQGHDEFLPPMLRAAGKEGIPRIEPARGVPPMPAADGSGTNSHSFLALTGAILQVQEIARGLSRLDPPHAAAYTENARVYGKRLRAILASGLTRLEPVDASRVRLATVHDGYAYLFRELGLTVTAVVQPRHGLEPSARQLADTIDRIKAAKVDVLFTEMDLARKYVDTIEAETRCRLARLTHISGGPYTADRFEKDMQANVDAIVSAVLATPRGARPR